MCAVQLDSLYLLPGKRLESLYLLPGKRLESLSPITNAGGRQPQTAVFPYILIEETEKRRPVNSRLFLTGRRDRYTGKSPPCFPIFSKLLVVPLLIQHSLYVDRQTEQVDKALLHPSGCKRRSASKVATSSSYRVYGEVTPALMMLPLYSFSLTSPVTVFWVSFTKAVNSLAQRSVPLTVVYDVSELDARYCLSACSFLIQGDGLQNIVCVVEDGSAGSFVNASGLHADQTVFYQIEPDRCRLRRPARSAFLPALQPSISLPSIAVGIPFSKWMVT